MPPSHWNPDLYIKAYRYAAIAHAGQLVPGTGISYIMHLSLVSMELLTAFQHSRLGPEEMDLGVQCALLHDSIEDTATSFGDIESAFGAPVAAGVQALTKSKDVPKEGRMADSLSRIKACEPVIWMVKLCDRITNMQPAPPGWDSPKKLAYKEEAILIARELGPASEYLRARLVRKIEEYGTHQPFSPTGGLPWR